MFALALHLLEDAFDKIVKDPEAVMRVLHYPPQDASRDDQMDQCIHGCRVLHRHHAG